MSDGQKLDWEKIGQRVRDLRKERKLTQEAAASAIGVARSTLAGIERGHDGPGLDTLAAIADYYGVPLDYLRPGPPRKGQFVEDPDELALLGFWRGLTPDQKEMVVRLLAGPIRKTGT